MKTRLNMITMTLTIVASLFVFSVSEANAQTAASPQKNYMDSPLGWTGAAFEQIVNDRRGMNNIVELAEGAGAFETLLAALDAADLTGALEGPGPFTVFAPTDDAFAKLPDPIIDFLLAPRNKFILQQVLTYHVVPGIYRAGDVVRLSTAPTLNGQDISFTIRDEGVFVENAQVIDTDFEASNGVVHVIDTVMIPRLVAVGPPASDTGRLFRSAQSNAAFSGTYNGYDMGNISGYDLVSPGPSSDFSQGGFIGGADDGAESFNPGTPGPESNFSQGTFVGGFDNGISPIQGVTPGVTMDIVDTAASAGIFKLLVAAVEAADLVAVLKGRGPYTVLAPTDEAFKKLGRATLRDLLHPDKKDVLAAILAYHVIPGKFMAADVVRLTSAPTLNGQDVTIQTRGNSVKVNNAGVVQTDILATNGVIHVIDTVLIPE